MKEFRFLKEKEIITPFRKIPLAATLTDYAILLGAYSKFLNNCSWYWTATSHSDEEFYAIDENGKLIRCDVNTRMTAVRPVVDYSEIKKDCTDYHYHQDSGILEVSYGEYPQTVASCELQEELTHCFEKKLLTKTLKKYTIDKIDVTDTIVDSYYEDIEEYLYENNKKYVRVLSNISSNEVILSDKQCFKTRDYVWVEVEPIKWLIDEGNDIAITKNLLYAGIQFYEKDNFDRNYQYSNAKEYLDEKFANQIYCSTESLKKVVEETLDVRLTPKRTKLQYLNPDVSTLESRRPLTDTELIKTWIDAGQSVLLRGPSGIGKTERLKNLYPNLIYLKLTNNMFPEKVVGSINLQTGQSIPPDFAIRALNLCTTDEEKEMVKKNIDTWYEIADRVYERTKNSKEKVVILLDELLNVTPAVQSLVYSLVLNKFIEIGGGLKLPANTVIVATGNQKKYSQVAYDLAEPLEKRFDHILDMHPKVNEWLNEYAIINKIHPSVISYIMMKYQSAFDKNVINYFYEEPEIGEKNLDKNGCNGKTNDPRSWTAVSNMLYAFEQNLFNGLYVGRDVEDILMRTLLSKLREEWAVEFYNFYNTMSLTVEEIVSNSYDKDDLPRNVNEYFAVVTSLLYVADNDLEIVRNFILENCGKEFLQIYDELVVLNDPERLETIEKLQKQKVLIK